MDIYLPDDHQLARPTLLLIHGRSSTGVRSRSCGHATEYGIDPDRIAILGYSAGAQLASLVGIDSDDPPLAPDCDAAAGQSLALPAAVISGSGPQDMREFWSDVGRDKSLPSALPDAYALASPVTHSWRDT